MVECDNQCLIKMILGEAETHSGDMPLINAINSFLTQDWEIKICHVYREANRAADWLAAFASQFPIGLKMIDQAPDGIKDILQQDYIGVFMHHLVSI